jgi:hypothetical protein
MIIQLRSQKIGLQPFLYRQRVPGITTPICPYCDRGNETVYHYTLECREWSSARGLYLEPYINRGLDWILGTREGTLGAIRFLVATKRLEQFQAIGLESLT